MNVRQRRAIMVLVILNTILVCALVSALFLHQDTVRQTLADWTGEEDPVHQFRALAFLALSFVQSPHQTADYAPMPYTDMPPFGVNTFFEQEVEEGKIR